MGYQSLKIVGWFELFIAKSIAMRNSDKATIVQCLLKYVWELHVVRQAATKVPTNNATTVFGRLGIN